MRNTFFLMISIVVCAIAITNSDLSSDTLMGSIVYPIIAFITLASSVIFFANRNSGKN